MEMEIGDALTQSAREAGLSEIDVAVGVGASESAVSRWFDKKRIPSGEYVIRLLKFVPGFGRLLGLPIGSL